MRRPAEGVAAAVGAGAALEVFPSYRPVYNEPALYETVAAQAERILGRERMVLQPAPSLGVESFSYFLKETPGVYYDLGCGVGAALHTPTFHVDEAVIPLGIEMQVASALAIMRQ